MKKTIALISYSILTGGMIASVFLVPAFSTLWQALFTILFSLTLIALFLGCFVFKKLYRTFISVFICEIIALAIYITLFYSGLLVHFKSSKDLKEWISGFGAWAWLVFFLTQILQVVVLPIPAQLTTIAGILAFDPWISFIISSIAVVVGSIIAFAIGRLFGNKILYKIAEKETVDKYRKLIDKKGRVLLPIMFIFPLFPDDLLCFIAGSTTMSWLYFIIITLATRIFGIGCICLFGSGDIIPFSGWGIPVWIVLGILLVTTAFVLIKNQDKFEAWVIKTFTKNGKQKTKIANTECANNFEVEKNLSNDTSKDLQQNDEKVSFSPNSETSTNKNNTYAKNETETKTQNEKIEFSSKTKSLNNTNKKD